MFSVSVDNVRTFHAFVTTDKKILTKNSQLCLQIARFITYERTRYVYRAQGVHLSTNILNPSSQICKSFTAWCFKDDNWYRMQYSITDNALYRNSAFSREEVTDTRTFYMSRLCAEILECSIGMRDIR